MSLPARGSYTVPFVVVSRTIGMLLSRKNWVADHCGRQIMPYLLNEIFSANSTQYISVKAYQLLCNVMPRFRHMYKPGTYMYAAASTVTDRHTCTIITVTLTHHTCVPRLNCVTTELQFRGLWYHYRDRSRIFWSLGRERGVFRGCNPNPPPPKMVRGAI